MTSSQEVGNYELARQPRPFRCDVCDMHMTAQDVPDSAVHTCTEKGYMYNKGVSLQDLADACDVSGLLAAVLIWESSGVNVVGLSVHLQ